MPLKRFQQIKRYLQVSNGSSDDSKIYFFNEMEPLMSHISTICTERWDPGYKLSVDKNLVTWLGDPRRLCE